MNNEDEWRLREREVVVKEREVVVKEKELQLKRNDQRVWRNPMSLGLLAAALSIAGNTVSNAYQATTARDLTQRKFQNDLVLAALNTSEPKIAAQRLGFLVRLGYVDANDMRLEYYITYPERLPIGPWPGDKIGNEYGKRDGSVGRVQ
jgi:hypothetical protein